MRRRDSDFLKPGAGVVCHFRDRTGASASSFVDS